MTLAKKVSDVKQLSSLAWQLAANAVLSSKCLLNGPWLATWLLLAMLQTVWSTVIVSSHLSVSEHVSAVISRCAQTAHALRILRSQGLCKEAKHPVYNSVIIDKLPYAVSAWWGFASAADQWPPMLASTLTMWHP